VAPSASAWRRAAGRAGLGAPPGTLAVAGPDLPGIDDELAGVVAAHGDVTVLQGREASVSAVLSSLPAVGVAHLAAHGRFRDDSPMFSSLDLADGPLTIHDLERLPAVPHLVVLSACDVGRSLVRPGNEVVGVVAAFLHLGSVALVASVVPVPHDVATRVTVAFHQALVAGRTPAEALATVAQREPLVPFVCFGAG
jgi:CHAT domain-containing protein